MLPSQFAGLSLLSGHKAKELCESIATKREGVHVVGVWCAMTGYAIRAVVADGVPVQWFIRGPMEIEDAREELQSPLPEISVRVH